MSEKAAASQRTRSVGEEIANSVSHGAGLVAALVALPFLCKQAARRGNVGYLAGCSVFGASIVFLYLASTLYHALPRSRAKDIFRIIEHSAIYLLIAGTYTPFTLGVLRGAWGWMLFGLIWVLATVGIVLKVSGRVRHPVYSTLLYVLMGWVVLVAGQPLWVRMPHRGFLWLFLGGLAYTVGVAFYAAEQKLPYSHFIWHLFVLAGTTLHYFAVLWYAG